jgi:hypothetical protein
MFNKGLIEPTEDDLEWQVTKQGRALLTTVVAMINAGLHFEVFASYNFEVAVPEEFYKPYSGDILDYTWDSRFDPAIEGHKEDLRIAMMMWMAEKLKRGGEIKNDLDPRRVVFLRHLSNGEFNEDSENFFRETNFKKIFKETQDIVDAAYRWESLGDSKEEAFKAGQLLYTAGMLQLKKEEGASCGECDTPLALFGDATECPVCSANLVAPEAEGADCECPNCHAAVRSDQPQCLKCGAIFDYRLPPGTVTEETTTTTVIEEEDDFGCYYGYQPYGWYDPYNPYVDAVAFGVVCGAILF